MTEPIAYEIEVFGMHDDRIAQSEEEVQYYDILVRGEPKESGEIDIIEEIENLDENQMNNEVTRLELKYNLTASYV